MNEILYFEQTNFGGVQHGSKRKAKQGPTKKEK
jgi:hypothetical protein